MSESHEWPPIATEFTLTVRELESERDDGKENWNWIVASEDEEHLVAGATPAEALRQFAGSFEGDDELSIEPLDPKDLAEEINEEHRRFAEGR